MLNLFIFHCLIEKLGKSYYMVNSYAQHRRQARVETLFEIAKILDAKVTELLNEKLPKAD